MMQENDHLSLTPYAIRAAIFGHIRGFLGNRERKLVILCTQLPIIPWIMEAASYKLGISTEASLL